MPGVSYVFTWNQTLVSGTLASFSGKWYLKEIMWLLGTLTAVVFVNFAGIFLAKARNSLIPLKKMPTNRECIHTRLYYSVLENE